MSLEFKIDTTQFLNGVQSVRKGVLPAMKKGLRNGMRFFSGHIQKTQMSGPTTSHSVSTRSGDLRRSWRLDIKDFGQYDYSVTLATDSKYAAIHQFSRTIVPKNAGALTVPIHPDAKNHRAGEFSNLVMQKRGGGRAPLLTERTYGKNAQTKLMYVLKKSVYIPKRLHVLEEFRLVGRKQVGMSIQRAIEGALIRA